VSYWTADCPATWPLLFPSAEDEANGITHGCIQEKGHLGPHRCTCGVHEERNDNEAE
jgi:hypothetical protein